MTAPFAILATLDTKAEEAAFVAETLASLGGEGLLVDLGVVGRAGAVAGMSREQVAAAGGRPLTELLAHPSRAEAGPVMVAGAIALLRERLARGELAGVIGLGGTQGTSSCTAVMQALPYGLPKVMVSTVASGDVAPFVGIKDITMMFSVGDILGLNPLLRRVLANAAGAAWGMARAGGEMADLIRSDRPAVGISNLGVLTEGTMRAVERLRGRGYESIVFHAVGSGGAAMEQLMKEGLIGAVFDYAMGEISDGLHHALRAGGPERLTVAGSLGLPQVLCPGGAEHVGLLLDEPDVVPPAWADHLHVFHSPVVLAPRLSAAQLAEVGREVGRRLQSTRGRACLMIPRRGTSRYSVAGGPLHDPDGDVVFFEALIEGAPASVQVVERDLAAEDAAFVDEAVDRLVALIEETP